jgi:hypothetical protein
VPGAVRLCYTSSAFLSRWQAPRSAARHMAIRLVCGTDAVRATAAVFSNLPGALDNRSRSAQRLVAQQWSQTRLTHHSSLVLKSSVVIDVDFCELDYGGPGAR